MDLKSQIHALVLTSRAPQYIIFFDELFVAKEENRMFDVIRRYNVKREKYESLLKMLEKKYPNYPEEIAYLKKIYQKYEQRYSKNVKTTNNISQAEIIVRDILESGYSIEEYCANKGISISKTYTSISSTKIYKQYFEELNSRSKEKFDQLIKNLIYGVLNENIDILDYFMQTNLDLNDFIRISKELLSSTSDCVAISTFARKGLTLIRMSAVNKEQEMKKFTSINGHEVTASEKENVFAFLEQNHLPLRLYHLALRKYLNGNLDLDQKEKIKKGR